MVNHLATATVQVKRKAVKTAKVAETKTTVRLVNVQTTVSVQILAHEQAVTTKTVQMVLVHKVKVALKVKVNQRANVNQNAVNLIALKY